MRGERPTEPANRVFSLSGYEAKLGAALKKAARSKNEEEKDSDESEEVPELGEDVSATT